MKTLRILITVLLLAVAAGAGAAQKALLGVIEIVRIQPEGFDVPAKLDTGADFSSLDARDIRYVERDGQSWVLFDVHDGSGHVRHMERPMVREAVIRKGQGTRQRRPVVKMHLCLANVVREVQVNLVDRDGFNFRMLIGRNFMDGYVIVDPALSMTAKPTCADGAGS